jgi:hypothetical protein
MLIEISKILFFNSRSLAFFIGNRIFKKNKIKINKPWINPNETVFLSPSDLFVGVCPRLDQESELIIKI